MKSIFNKYVYYCMCCNRLYKTRLGMRFSHWWQKHIGKWRTERFLKRKVVNVIINKNNDMFSDRKSKQVKYYSHISKNPYGLTLVELLFCIAIIGILASLSIPALVNYRRSHQDKNIESAEDGWQHSANSQRKLHNGTTLDIICLDGFIYYTTADNFLSHTTTTILAPKFDEKTNLPAKCPVEVSYGCKSSKNR